MNCKGCKHCVLISKVDDEYVNNSFHYCNRGWALDDCDTISEAWKICKGKYYEKKEN